MKEIDKTIMTTNSYSNENINRDKVFNFICGNKNYFIKHILNI